MNSWILRADWDLQHRDLKLQIVDWNRADIHTQVLGEVGVSHIDVWWTKVAGIPRQALGHLHVPSGQKPKC